MSSQSATYLSLLGLHLTFGFPLGQTEEAKPILEPDKEEAGELGSWGMRHFVSLGAGKLASMLYFRSVNVVAFSFLKHCVFFGKKQGQRQALGDGSVVSA